MGTNIQAPNSSEANSPWNRSSTTMTITDPFVKIAVHNSAARYERQNDG
jgi:hypothetical protein